MLAHDCPACGRRELIFADQITGLDNLPEGFEVRFTCWCGSAQTRLEERIVAAA